MTTRLFCALIQKSKTDDAEIKPKAHAQRASGAESGAESGTGKWTAEGRVNPPVWRQ